VQVRVFLDTLLHRWYLVLVVLAATVAAGILVVRAVGPTYEATGAVLVLPPRTTVQQGLKEEANGNPYLALGGLTQVRDIAIRSVASQETNDDLCRLRPDPAYASMRNQLCKSDPAVTYDVTPDFTNSAPIVLVTVDADSAQNALVALDAVMERVPVVLSQLQAGMKLKADATITSAPLVADRQPEVVRKDQIRAGIVGAAGTLGLGLLAVGLIDALLGVRAQRRDEFSDQSGWWDEEAEAFDRLQDQQDQAPLRQTEPALRG
jgi:hypothetical protein